ncbi:hypothetical protein JKP88DRAFT_245884 [Tribonema minus]|uniref:Uncharacterized protein n=1 Tax=Tribonema minus TaxID=303371 RepID=A0A836CE99_9STRA|nr:hypothetical protein JKP88DRAFT_245884 [Tribonema minus]
MSVACDESHARHLLAVVAADVNSLHEQRPCLIGPQDVNGSVQQILQPQVELQLENADKILAIRKGVFASSPSQPARPLAERLQPMLGITHAAVISMQACYKHPGKQQAVRKPSELASTEPPAQRHCRNAPTPPATASAVLMSEPGQAVWKMLGRGYWLPVAGVSRGVRAAYTRELLKGRGDSGKGGGCVWLCRTSLGAVLQSDAVFRMLSVAAGTDSAAKINCHLSIPYQDAGLLQLLQESQTARLAVGKGQLSCSLIRDAVTAGLPLDGYTLVGAAERGCEAALNQWHTLLSDSPQWHAQEAWVLPVMALCALDAKERPSVLAVLRWVFRTATRQVGGSTSEAQLPPLLLTVLAFKCAALGDFDTFRWLYADGRQLTKQDIHAHVPVPDLNAFRQAMDPFGAVHTDLLYFMLKRHDAAVTHTLVDIAIAFTQGEFVTLLSRSDVSAPLSAFKHFSAAVAAHSNNLGLLQWPHAHPGCTFNSHQVIRQFLITRKAPRQSSGTAAVTVAQHTLDALKWLRDIGAFEAATQIDLTTMVTKTATSYAAWLCHSSLVKLQWLLHKMGAAWPNGGAALIVRSMARLNQRQEPDPRSVLALVSQLDCPWGPWTSAECEIMRSNAERLMIERAALMRRLHELGCPCACARPDSGGDDNAAAAHGGGSS